MAAVYRTPADSATPAAGARAIIRPVPVSAIPHQIVPGEVHIWVVAFDPNHAEPDGLLAALSPDELARYERYGNLRAKYQFARCRAALRQLLGGYLGCEPCGVRFVLTPDGKPVLAGSNGANRFHFNVSHTDGLGLIAVAGVSVGIDVETEREAATADALVERFFSPEEGEQYRRLPAEVRPAAFLRGWTCKEAILKGVGCGARGLDSCAVDLDPRRPPRIVSLGGPAAACGTAWGLGCWRPMDGISAAVAVCGVESVALA